MDSLKHQWIKDNNIRRTEDCPQTYPNGWNAVLESNNLSKNQIKPIQAFGKDLVVFRGSSGKCYTMDAYCAHMGANLGVGGTVIEDSVRCLFHGWIYDSNGKCTHIPGIDCIKSTNAKMRTYETIEMNGFICVWNPSEDNLRAEWYPTKSDPIDEQNIVYRGKITNITNCHIQDIFENIADSQHVVELHHPPTFLGNLIKKPKFYEFVLKIMHLEITIDWKAGTGTKKHTVDTDTVASLLIFGFPIMRITGFTHCMGPTLGYSVFNINLWRIYKIYVRQALIQKQDFNIHLVQKVYSGKGLINIIISRIMMRMICEQFNRDAIILSNRKYLKHPMFAKNERPMVGYRRWYKQFECLQ